VGERAREWAGRYTLEQQARRYRSLYAELCASAARPSPTSSVFDVRRSN